MKVLNLLLAAALFFVLNGCVDRTADNANANTNTVHQQFEWVDVTSYDGAEYELQVGNVSYHKTDRLYIVVNWKVNNKGKSVATITHRDFTLVDSDGSEYTCAPYDYLNNINAYNRDNVYNFQLQPHESINADTYYSLPFVNMNGIKLRHSGCEIALNPHED